MRRIDKILIAMLLAVLASCGTSEFKIEMQLEGAGTQNLRFIYYSTLADGSGRIEETAVPIVDGKLTLTGISLRPTLVSVFTPSRSLVAQFYVAPGDELKLSGKYSEPFGWTAEGNKIQEEWSRWQQANKETLQSDDADKINSAIARYVEVDKSSEAAALMILCNFCERDNADEKARLWNLLDNDAKSKDIVNAATGTDRHVEEREMRQPVSRLILYCPADSMISFSPSDAPVSLLYFWRLKDQTHRERMKMLERIYDNSASSAKKDKLQIADINLDDDTFAWKRSVRTDSIKWTRLWAIGGEMNLSVRNLNVPRSPYFIVLDSAGRQIYRGSDTTKIKDCIKGVYRSSLKKATK